MSEKTLIELKAELCDVIIASDRLTAKKQQLYDAIVQKQQETVKVTPNV
jgi:hypothetical protein